MKVKFRKDASTWQLYLKLCNCVIKNRKITGAFEDRGLTGNKGKVDFLVQGRL